MLTRDVDDRVSRRFVAMAAFLAMSLHSTSANAGNLTLTLTGFPAVIDVRNFSVGASKVPSFPSGTVTTPASFQDAGFTAVESSATPLKIAKLITGERLATAQLVVLSPISGQLVSDWTFEEALVTSVSLIHASGASTFPTTSFTLSYNKVTYRVFAADGSVAQRSCWNIVSNVAC